MELTKKRLEIKLKLYVSLIVKEMNAINHSFMINKIRINAIKKENSFVVNSRFFIFSEDEFDLFIEVDFNKNKIKSSYKFNSSLRTMIEFNKQRLNKSEEIVYNEISKLTINDEVFNKLENF